MIKHLFLYLICGCLIISGCTSGNFTAIIAKFPPQSKSETLTVFAAGSLTEAFTELAEIYDSENPGTKIQLNVAGSQQLAQQLAQGAPADVYASANLKQMQVVIDAGRIREQAGMGVDIFAANQLTIIYPQGNPAQITNLSNLSQPGLKLVIADNAVPVGYYTQIFLENAEQDASLGLGFKAGVQNNVVSYENSVRAVLSKVILGEADAGIVYISDAWTKNSGQIGQIPIPAHLNVTAHYYIAPLSDSLQKQIAQDFIYFVRSPRGQAVMAKYGFMPIQ
jgi:molybdate transport system substrate-binding protein